MQLNILSQDYYDDIPSQKLVGYLHKIFSDNDEVKVFYRFPLIKELDQEIRFPHILLISPYHGVVAFKCSSIEKDRGNNELDDLIDEISWIEDYIFSKLIKSSSRKIKKGKRDLAINLSSALFIPFYCEDANKRDFLPLIQNEIEVRQYLEDLNSEKIEEDIIRQVFSIIEGSTAIIRPKERIIEKEDFTSKAFLLKKMEQEIAVFDEEQKYAALSQLRGPQRIRGLAGTGKTIILAMKAALIHLNNPNAKILYTFMTKSLYDYIETLVTRFYKTLGDGQIPDLENSIHIRHAWGGNNVKGVYYDCCVREGIAPITFREANIKSAFPFDYICEDILTKKKGKLNQYYDYVLIDEAQDFKPSFYQLCRSIVKNDSIVWGYDDLQNIFDVKIQDTMRTFANEFGDNGINLPELQKKYPEMENDIVLSKSYRNPREILVLAHAIGFGIYNDILIQSLENNAHWNDLGYRVVQGKCVSGDKMIIERPAENSPLSISKDQTADELIVVNSAANVENEIAWVVDQIEKAIKIDKLRADDIMVISIDDRWAKRYFTQIASDLYSKDIRTYNLSAISYQKGFYEDECVTLSTLYKAKGNEAAMVFVIGCDVCEEHRESIIMRNKLFTAFTRTKAWLRVSGCNIIGDWLVKELESVKANNFMLKFTYKEASVIKRDLDDVNIRKTKERERFQEYIKDVKKKGISREEMEQIIRAEFGEMKN